MVNRVILQGRFTAKPEVKQVGGFDMTEFTIAWSEKYKEKETKCFLRCKSWREQAKFIERYFSKGQEVVIEGRLSTEEWEKDGQKQSRTICNVEKVNFCGSKNDVSSSERKAESSNSSDDSDDDLMNVPEGEAEELPFS